MRIGWFSAGNSSACAIKMDIKNIDKIIYIHIEDQHEDTLRFVNDCAEWFGKEIEIIQSPLKTVEAACLGAGGRGYINGVAGAACSLRLKKKVREDWQKENTGDHVYYWGLDANEESRIYNILCSMPEHNHEFPLLRAGLNKQAIHQKIKASGIKRPAMYDLGYHNNNCRGCVKGGKNYWGWVRLDFPEVFKARAEMERKVGATCLKESDGTRLYLDDLPKKYGKGRKPIVPDCGLFCSQVAL